MRVLILGTRGIPAKHGGFETFAEQLALYLTSHGHQVTVYCQNEKNQAIYTDMWNGIERVFVHGPVGPVGTILFDWRSVLHSIRKDDVVLTLGYNTAVFSLMYHLYNRTTVMNMDGIEWKRQKWSHLERLWLRLNELAGARLSKHLIADHPRIREHLKWAVDSSKVTVIPYGADAVHHADESVLEGYGLNPRGYALVIARPEPENSILEIVGAYSQRERGIKLVVLGKFNSGNAYHQTVLKSASPEVVFPGAIYDRRTVEALRFHSRVYLHGHQVGGTNPSLVEALAAGNPVIAHDNQFTRWVAGDGAEFFTNDVHLAAIFDELLGDDAKLSQMSNASRKQHNEKFTQERVMNEYESLLLRFSPAGATL